jgi:hypothetical protein
VASSHEVQVFEEVGVGIIVWGASLMKTQKFQKFVGIAEMATRKLVECSKKSNRYRKMLEAVEKHFCRMLCVSIFEILIMQSSKFFSPNYGKTVKI